MRVLVCGGRDFANPDWMKDSLRALHARSPITALIHGCAPGADSLAGFWAQMQGIPEVKFPADWSLGKRAGPIRNQKMIDEGKPDLVVAFPGGRGTADMVRRAKVAKIKLWEP